MKVVKEASSDMFHVVEGPSEGWVASFQNEKDAHLFVRATEIHDAFEAGAQEIADKFGDFDVDIRRVH
ncbi:hypothetical protein LCGC14_0988100 [marine sediment metagenome]|uniref:Uncharacterized protein n=1 Tax=marine sediment metagenome TaxID=412755 RepID=A0A0F9NTA0_9ZZZZ